MTVVHSDIFLLVFVLPFGVAYLAMTVQVMRRLETHHEEIWRQLGSPAGLSLSIKTGWGVTKYILFQGKYRTLGDVQLNWLVWITRGLGWWSFLGIWLHKFGLGSGLTF